MVDIRQALESSYITVDLVRASPSKKCVILDAGEYVEAEYNGKKYAKFQFNVEIDGKTKTWAPNKDTLTSLYEEYGYDSKDFVGKIMNLRIGKHLGKDCVNGFPQIMPKVSEDTLN